MTGFDESALELALTTRTSSSSSRSVRVNRVCSQTSNVCGLDWVTSFRLSTSGRISRITPNLFSMRIAGLTCVPSRMRNNSSRCRSGDVLGSSLTAWRMALIVSGRITKPSDRANRTPRNIRTGSSVKLDGEQARSNPARRSLNPFSGSMSSPGSNRLIARALIVKSRPIWSASKPRPRKTLKSSV